MTREQLLKGMALNKELENLNEMKRAMNEEERYWWSFLTPGIKSRNDRGVLMTDTLRKKFQKAVDEAITEIENMIEEL